MHVEMVDAFRCTAAHADSWLVAAADVTVDRVILEGVLGCPLCGAEYVIRDCVAMFGEWPVSAQPADQVFDQAEGEELVHRLAALLDLSTPDVTIALLGYSPALIAALQDVVPVRVVVIVSDSDTTLEGVGQPSYPYAIAQCGNRLPFAHGSLHGIASAVSSLPVNAMECLREGGRLLAPLESHLPKGFTEIARDKQEWLATRDVGASGLVNIRRNQSPE